MLKGYLSILKFYIRVLSGLWEYAVQPRFNLDWLFTFRPTYRHWLLSRGVCLCVRSCWRRTWLKSDQDTSVFWYRCCIDWCRYWTTSVLRRSQSFVCTQLILHFVSFYLRNFYFGVFNPTTTVVPLQTLHWMGNAFMTQWWCVKKVKVAHTRLLSVGFRSWSRFLAVSLQVTWVINLAVGCHYFLPGLQLPLQPLTGLLPVSLLGEQRHDGCEQLA